MRRLVDLVVSAAGALLLAPVLAVAAVLVRLRLGRPVLFRQVRTGQDGAEFAIVKLRTMRPEAWPGEPDTDRDTELGKTLRRLSLDEVPQLWNVLRGDMSIIGPRPTLPEQVVHYSDTQRGRLAVRPGLTGWAQVNGRNSISWPQRIQLDLYWIEHRSLALDLRIILLTVTGLVRPRGIYGEGGVNPGFPLPESNPPPTRPGGGAPCR